MTDKLTTEDVEELLETSNRQIREEAATFFYSQLRKGHSVAYTGVGDFAVDGKWTFEVGGKGKGFDRIANVSDSYVVNDEVSVGHGNKIPLWLFGFLY